MKNVAVAKVLSNIADLLELKGESPFKIRAYQRAARSLEYLSEEVEQVTREARLEEIPGVGEAIAKKITELVTTGRLGYYEELRSEFPAGISTLLDVPGIGPKKAKLLSTELGISSVEELEAAILDGKVASLPRMGEKTAENMLHQIQAMRRKDQRILIGEALPLAEEVLSAIRPIPGVRNLIAAGSLRRFRETIGDIDLMGTADNAEEVIEAFVGLPLVREVLAKGTTKASVIVSGGLQVDLRMVEHDSFGSLLQYFTGSKQHNILLRERGRKQGLKLSEYGITDLATGLTQKFPTEEGFYRRLGLAYIPPELREGQREIEMAEENAIPPLVELSDIRGDLHVHTNWSDGRDSLEDMALAAKALGYSYMAITDHSVGRGIARGLNPERLKSQHSQIQELNDRIEGFRLLTGTEVDIRSDGSLDFPNELLSGLEVVVAAVHSAMNQDREQMTRRLLKALENPYVTVLAHPTCRLLGEREPVAVDLEEVFKAAAREGVPLEVNAMPSRLDLKDSHISRARELGVKLVMSTDSHSVAHLGLMRFGVGTARRGWCQRGDILNTRPWTEARSEIREGLLQQKLS